MTRLVNPIPIFLDERGALVDGGYIYIGTANTDPEVLANQLSIFWDKAQTIPAVQPLRTVGGVIVNGLNLGFIYFAATDFSITIRDSDSNLVAYVPSAFDLGGTSYQPLDSDLTAIAALATTSFGRSFLTLADAPAGRALIGLGTIATFDETTTAQFRSNAAGKALSTDKVWGAALYVALTPGATVNLDLSLGINFSLAMGGNYTLANFTNGKEGQSGKIFISQDATGGRTLAYGTAYKSVGGSAPVLSTASNARDLLYYEVLPGGTTAAISLAKNVP